MNFRLTDIEIKNIISYKNIESSKFSNIKDYNVLIGKNNAGKSNLFKILVYLQDYFMDSGSSINKFNKTFIYDENQDEDISISLIFSLSEGFRIKFFSKIYELGGTQFIRNIWSIIYITEIRCYFFSFFFKILYIEFY